MKSLREALKRFMRKYLDNPLLVGAKIKKDSAGPYISVLHQSWLKTEDLSIFPDIYENFRVKYIPAKSRGDLELGL